MDIVEQNGPFLKPENLINISGKVELIDYDIEKNELDKVEMSDNVEDDARLRKSKNAMLARSEIILDSYKEYGLDKEKGTIQFLLQLNMEIGVFIKLKAEYESLNIVSTEKEAIVKYIFDKLVENYIYYKELKPNDINNKTDGALEKYFDFIKSSIPKDLNYLHIFILMYQSFIVNHLWMLFPKDNKYFIAYVIDRIRQSIDEGRNVIVKYYEENNKNKEFGYDVTNKPSFNIFYEPETSTAVDKFKSVNFNKSNIDNFAIWTDIEKIMEQKR